MGMYMLNEELLVPSLTCYGALVLGSRTFSIMSKLPKKTTLASKVIKMDSKTTILLC